MNRENQSYKAYIATSIAGLLMLLLAGSNAGLYREFGLHSIVLTLASGGAVAGIVLLSLWALVWVKRQGALDGISYSLSVGRHMLLPFTIKKNEDGTVDQPKKYYDYCQDRRTKEKESGVNLRPLWLVGAVYFAIGVLFTILFFVV